MSHSHADFPPRVRDLISNDADLWALAPNGNTPNMGFPVLSDGQNGMAGEWRRVPANSGFIFLGVHDEASRARTYALFLDEVIICPMALLWNHFRIVSREDG